MSFSPKESKKDFMVSIPNFTFSSKFSSICNIYLRRKNMPAITFQVNLTTVDSLSCRQPYTSTEATNFASTRSTWFPNLLRDNRELKHGATFTISDGVHALYVKNNFTTGEFKFLDVVSSV